MSCCQVPVAIAGQKLCLVDTITSGGHVLCNGSSNGVFGDQQSQKTAHRSTSTDDTEVTEVLRTSFFARGQRAFKLVLKSITEEEGGGRQERSRKEKEEERKKTSEKDVQSNRLRKIDFRFCSKINANPKKIVRAPKIAMRRF